MPPEPTVGSADQLLANEEAAVDSAVWVYTGSQFNEDIYAAARDGTLVGFVHDPASIIEHRTGMGLGNYGTIGGNQATAPPVGTPVCLTVIAGDSSSASPRE